MSRRLYGEVVAMLPFEPLGFLQGLSHRGLPGDNMYEASVVRGGFARAYGNHFTISYQ